MDIALEIWDTFIGDRLYSALLPVSLSSSVSVPGFANAANSSLALFGASQPFVYEPATQLIHLEPSKYAYMSAWPRNNIYRQFLSFFLIVWYVVLSLPFVFFFYSLADWRLFLQDLWHDHLFHICLAVLHIYLGQDDHQAPEIPQKPDSHGDSADHGVNAHYVASDCPFLGCRGPWLRQTVRYIRAGAVQILQSPSIPAVHRVHRSLHLLDPPRIAPSLDL